MKRASKTRTVTNNPKKDLPRPVVCSVNFENIPEELKKLDQWVVWRLELAKDRWTKVPYRAENPKQKASSTDPSSWASFDQARTAYEKGQIDGVGLVLSGVNGLVGLDLDKCRDPETGKLDPWASEMVTRLGCYAEASPSGTGVRMFARGYLKRTAEGKPTGRTRTKKGNVEFYDGLKGDLQQGGRYLTVTGQNLNSCAIKPCQLELERIYDEVFGPSAPPLNKGHTVESRHENSNDDDLLERIKISPQRVKFERLWAGDASEYARNGNEGRSEADLALCSILACWTNDPARIDRLFRGGGLYRAKWERADYRERTIQKAISNKQPGGGHLIDKPEVGGGHAQYPVVQENTPEDSPDPDTDFANANRLRRLLADQVAYTPGMGWLIYEAGSWRVVAAEHICRLAMGCLAQQVRREAAEVDVSANGNFAERKALTERAERLWKWSKRCDMKHTLNDAIDLLKNLVLCEGKQWDADPWLLNVENGVLDLRTQTLREHEPGDYMTKRAPVVFNPKARHSGFESLLELLDDDGIAEYLCGVLGSCLVGEVPNDKLFVLIGKGGTGKSTLMEAVMAVMGDYAVKIDTATLIEAGPARPGGARADLLQLRGARLVVGHELPKNARMNAADVKALTGGDSITARAPYSKQPITFRPTFKTILHTNYDLHVEEDDDGLRRRLVRIPFVNKPSKLNLRLKGQLQNDPKAKSALLNWLLKGLSVWHKSDFDLEVPEVIKAAIESFWRGMDPFAEWADQSLVFDKKLITPFGDLYKSYCEWCDAEGIRSPEARASLGRWLSKNTDTEPTTLGKAGSKARKGVGIRGDYE